MNDMTKFTPDKTNHVEDSIPSTHSQSVFELAQQYIALGWKLCALEPGTKSPKTPGWERNPIEPTQIRNRGIGLLHSLSRTCAIDLDNLNDCHYWFYNHNIDLNMLLQDDDAVQIVSGRPNRGKLLYRLPESCAPLQTWQVKGHDKAMLVEFRCVARTGGSQQDVLPPSIHPDTGKPYQWGGNGDFRQLPELPATLLALWNSRPTQTVPTSVQQEIRVIQNSGKIPEGGRNNELFKMGGDLAFNGLSLEAIEAALQVSNQQKCTPPLPRGEVSTIARSVMTSSQGAKLAGVDFSGLMTQVGQQANPSGTGAASQNDEPFTVEQQADYDTLKSAVMAIPTSARLPDSKHDAQTTIGFALSSEYGQTHRGQAAVIAREWDAKTGGRAFDVFTRADPEYADKGGDPVTKNSIFKLAQANGWTDTAKGQPDDDQDLHRNTPKPSPDCLYGLVGDIARAGSENTEANVYAVAMSAIAYMGAAIGRGPYLSIGDDWHHTNGFFLHIGRSARGRKGTAKKLIKRIANAVKNIHESLAPQIHTGGLSSREGLVFLIHDGITQGTITIPPVDDKRLLVIESEFANVLHQSKRDGNTLSPAIRDSWDGTSIKPATKTSRTWATHPHISLMGDITPSELLLLMKSQDFTNGFANRFLMIFAEGEKVNPFPKKTPNETIDYFAQRIRDILEFSRANFHKEKDTAALQTDSAHSVKMLNLSLRAMQTFQCGLLTLKKLRSSGDQRITIQHVNVTDGGQAVIGQVQPRGTGGKI